jgi:uncharacterized membrane protein
LAALRREKLRATTHLGPRSGGYVSSAVNRVLTSRLVALRTRWHSLLYGFLFLPGVIALTLVGLAFLLVWIDRFGGAHGVAGFGGDAPAARSILTTIATALITVAGLTFSITLVTLQLVSQQFTPRALKNFLADRVSQLTAGAFVGIFAFCLIVLRAVREGKPSPEFVPGLSMSVATGLGVATLGLLLAFIHHTSRSIQLSTIASRIAHASLAAAENLYPETLGEPSTERAAELLRSWRAERPPALTVKAPRPGYVESIALGQVLDLAGISHARLHIAVAPGDFVTPESRVVDIWPDGFELDRDVARRIVTIADERELTQDVLYGLRQLADIAIKALSPGVNDPTTAVTCIGHMHAVLERVAQHRIPAEVRRYDDRDVVAIVRRHTFGDYLAPLAEVARHARDDARVAAVVSDVFDRLEEQAQTRGADDRAEDVRHARPRPPRG